MTTTIPALVQLDEAEAKEGVLAAALALAETTPPYSSLSDSDEAFYVAWRLLLGRVADLTERPGGAA